MGARIAIAVLAVVVVGVSGVAYHEHARATAVSAELALANHARETCEHAAKDARPSAFAGLASALSAASAAKARAERSAKTDGEAREVARRDGGTGSFENMPGDEQVKVFDAIDKVKEETGKKLADLRQKLHLDPKQDKVLTDQIDAMNKAVVEGADRLLTVLSRSKDPPPRPLIDALADGLDAIRKADDAFRGSLDDEQKRAFDADGFDLSSQIDPMPLFTRALALAASRSEVSVSAKGDGP